MRPSEPFHAVTTLYREPAGLRELDFYIQRLNDLQTRFSDHTLNVGVLGDEHGDFVLPFAVMGFEVTGFVMSEKSAALCHTKTQELGVPANFMIQDISESKDRLFDVIICANLPDQLPDVLQTLERIRYQLAKHGRILLRINKQSVKSFKNSYSKLIDNLLSANYRICWSENTGLNLQKLYKQNNSQRARSSLFHLLDALDSRLANHAPRKLARGWLLELAPSKNLPLIIQLIPTLAVGGAERVAAQLAENLPAYDFENLIIANVRGGQLQTVLQQKNIPFIVLERPDHLGRWKTFWRLYRILSDLKPAVVHTHLFAADFWGRLAARLAGVKNVVTTVHNIYTDYAAVGEFIMRVMSGFSKCYIAISAQVHAYMTSKLGINHRRIKIVFNGIDLTGFRRRPNIPFQDIPRLMFVGRLEPQKNLDTLFAALSAVSKPWHLDIYGAGSLENTLRRQAENLSLASRITWMGVKHDMPGRYADYDLFLFPSRWEGFGLAAIEAAISGVPVVISDLPVMHELFDEQNATFVDPEDAQKIAQTIIKILNDPSSATHKAQKFTQQNSERFSLDSMVKSYAYIYRRLMGGQACYEDSSDS